MVIICRWLVEPSTEPSSPAKHLRMAGVNSTRLDLGHGPVS